jgi:hypothetical protein
LVSVRRLKWSLWNCNRIHHYTVPCAILKGSQAFASEWGWSLPCNDRDLFIILQLFTSLYYSLSQSTPSLLWCKGLATFQGGVENCIIMICWPIFFQWCQQCWNIQLGLNNIHQHGHIQTTKGLCSMLHGSLRPQHIPLTSYMYTGYLTKFCNIKGNSLLIFMGGATVIVLAIHHYDLGLILRLGVIHMHVCELSLLLLLSLASRVFLRVLWFSSLHKNQLVSWVLCVENIERSKKCVWSKSRPPPAISCK